MKTNRLIEAAKMRGAGRHNLNRTADLTTRDKIANDLYPDNHELANAFREGWDRTR